MRHYGYVRRESPEGLVVGISKYPLVTIVCVEWGGSLSGCYHVNALNLVRVEQVRPVMRVLERNPLGVVAPSG